MLDSENPLFFSASLAQTIGLNEAILIQFLQQSTTLSQGVFVMSQVDCQNFFSFWNNEQTHQVFINLQSLGLIELTQSHGGQWAGKVASIASAKQDNGYTSATVIENPEISRPAVNEMHGHNNQPQNSAPQRSEVIQNSVPLEQNEARLYNQSRGNPLGHLQQPKSTPIYAQSNNSLSKMNANWKPSEQFHEMLRLHNIPTAFASEQLPVFKQYYIDSGKTAMSWDSRFINWVQRAKASARSQEGQYEQKQTYSDPGRDAKQRKEEVRQKLRDINDTSWAD